MNLFRSLLLALLAISIASCASRKGKARAKIYDADSNPGIRMHDESPGSPVGE